MLLKQQLWQLEYTVAIKKWLEKPHVCSTANSSHSEQKHDRVSSPGGTLNILAMHQDNLHGL
jgi:hypothetical protein